MFFVGGAEHLGILSLMGLVSQDSWPQMLKCLAPLLLCWSVYGLCSCGQELIRAILPPQTLHSGPGAMQKKAGGTEQGRGGTGRGAERRGLRGGGLRMLKRLKKKKAKERRGLDRGGAWWFGV